MPIPTSVVRLCRQLLQSDASRITSKDGGIEIVRVKMKDVVNTGMSEFQRALMPVSKLSSGYCHVSVIWAGELFDHLGPETGTFFVVVEIEG